MLTPKEVNLKKEVSDVLFITGLLSLKQQSLRRRKPGNENDEEKAGNGDNQDNDDAYVFLSNQSSHVGINYIETSTDENLEGTPNVGGGGGGKLWVRYDSIANAQKMQQLLHQIPHNGKTIMCRYELGYHPLTGERLVSRNSIHTTCIRRVQPRKGQQGSCGGKQQLVDSDTKKKRNRKTNTTSTAETFPANYSYKSLLVGETEYPFPSGVYMSRLISLVQKYPNRSDDPLLQLVSNNYVPPTTSKRKSRSKNQSAFGNHYAKEITESMAMVDAVERAMKLCFGRSTSSFQQSGSRINFGSSDCIVRVYCIGDGKYPLTAASMALHYPYVGWEFVSIDPILDSIDDVNEEQYLMHRPRIHMFTGKSQNYSIPKLPTFIDKGDDKTDEEKKGPDDDDATCDIIEDNDVQYVDVVVACHSHAPLQEFWDRILKRIQNDPAGNNSNNSSDDGHPGNDSKCCRAIAITMPCCANYSDLKQPPEFVFDDNEVYSPKRKIHIYCH